MIYYLFSATLVLFVLTVGIFLYNHEKILEGLASVHPKIHFMVVIPESHRDDRLIQLTELAVFVDIPLGGSAIMPNCEAHLCCSGKETVTTTVKRREDTFNLSFISYYLNSYMRIDDCVYIILVEHKTVDGYKCLFTCKTPHVEEVESIPQDIKDTVSTKHDISDYSLKYYYYKREWNPSTITVEYKHDNTIKEEEEKRIKKEKKKNKPQKLPSAKRHSRHLGLRRREQRN